MRRTATPQSKIKMFQPMRWHRHMEPHRYIAHLYKELGRLGLSESDIEHYDRSHTQSVLTDIIDHLFRRDNQEHLYEWQNLNIMRLLRQQANQHRTVKPRIEISAHITKAENLSVRWHPLGWQETVYWDPDHAGYGFGRCKVVPMSVAMQKRRQAMELMEAPPIITASDTSNVVTPKFSQTQTQTDIEDEVQSDFLFFAGDEESSWNSRPSNELMFIHGVGHLDIGRNLDDYGPYLEYNRPTVDETLICLVRSAYEHLIERLNDNFEVTVRTVFEFQETDGRITDWSLEDPEVIQQRKDQVELAAVEQEYGFSVEAFSEQLRIITETDTPRHTIDQKLARSLTKAGHKITPSRVEHLRVLIGRCPRP